MMRWLIWLSMLIVVGCSILEGHGRGPVFADGVAFSPPPSELPLPGLSSDQARVERVLGMEQDRLWVSLSVRPVGIEPRVLFRPRGGRLPSMTARCPQERNLARALVVFLNERLQEQVMTLDGMAVTDEEMVADVRLNGAPLQQRLEAEGLARPQGAPHWCP